MLRKTNWITATSRFLSHELGHLLFLTHYAQTMRVLGPIQTETRDSFTDSLLAFSVFYRRAWYGLGNGFRLITQRSVD